MTDTDTPDGGTPAVEPHTPAAYQPIHLGPFTLLECELLVPPEPPPIGQAGELGDFLENHERSLPWQRGDWAEWIINAYGEDHAQLLSDMPGQEETLKDYGRVCRAFPPGPAREYAVLGVPFTHHRSVINLPMRKARHLLKKAYEMNWTVAEIRQAVRRLRREQIVTGTADVPEGKFRVIYADPPWAYEQTGVVSDKNEYVKAEGVYPTMSVEDICELPIHNYALDNSVLFLWVPPAILPDAFLVLEAWGFNFKNKIVWWKQRHVWGSYVSNQHEDLLIATRGSCRPDRLSPMISNVQAIKWKEDHSSKPRQFRKIISDLYNGPRLELFARDTHDAWTCVGANLGTLVTKDGIVAPSGKEENAEEALPGSEVLEHVE